jgi:mannose-6-phosphate isomerase class I
MIRTILFWIGSGHVCISNQFSHSHDAKDLGELEGLHICERQRTLLSFGQSRGSQVTQEENDIAQLVLKLNKQFPGDIEIFCPFLLNYFRLDPGQAIFLGAGEPHAYISGGRPYYP